jgi:UDP-3-O-[3-hydroxymyristoyl] N-acetylglucosamine deacetylase
VKDSKCASIDFSSRAIGQQRIAFAMIRRRATEIAYARTFGFAQDVEKLRSMGLSAAARWTTPSSSMATTFSIRRAAGSRRIRALNCWMVGDLFLAGGRSGPEGEQPGHALNNKLLRAVFADESAFAWRSDAA